MELHDAEESMAIRKILAHDIRMKKNPQTKGTRSGLRIFIEPKVQLAPPHGNLINGVANPEIVYMLLRF